MAKKVYTDGLKNIGKKLGFAAGFTDIIRSMAFPEEASIHTTKMTAINIALIEIQNREDKRWVICIDSHSSSSPLNIIKRTIQYI